MAVTSSDAALQSQEPLDNLAIDASSVDAIEASASPDAKPAVGDRRFTLAARHIRAGDAAMAQDVYLAILRDRPKDTRARTALARLGMSLQNSETVKAAIARPADMDAAVLATSVGYLLKAGEVFALRDMIVTHREASAPHVDRFLRRCQDLTRADITRSDRAALYRCIIDVVPDDTVALTRLARLFDTEMAECRQLSGQALIDATSKILAEDPEHAIAARLKAQACLEAAQPAEAFQALFGLRDDALVPARTHAMLLAASQASIGLHDHARVCLRLMRIKGTQPALILRASRNGIKAATAGGDHEATACFAEAILAVEPEDVSATRLKASASSHLTRAIVAAIRGGDSATVQRLLTDCSYLLGDGVKRSAKIFLERQARRSAVQARRAANPPRSLQ